MNLYDVSLIPPVFVAGSDERFDAEGRLWQSAPSAALTENGRIFCVCSADNLSAGEETSNYNLCAFSDDGGRTFSPVFCAYHEHDVRISETLLFMSPDGRLYHFWTQNYKYFDGRGGIWCAVCDEPDAPSPRFGEPRRICDGCMADNPVVLSDGRWLFPASVWTHIRPDRHPLPEYEKVSVWESSDDGNTLSYLGGVEDPTPSFSENTVFECADGRLVMLLRTVPEAGGIKKSESSDGGRTWSEAVPFFLPGPSSRFMVSRFPSGALLIVTHYRFSGRNNLTALLSDDDGQTFPCSLLLDDRSDVSYPSGNIRKDGRVMLAYDRERTGAREILLASFTEEDIRRGSFGPDSYSRKVVFTGGKKGGA